MWYRKPTEQQRKDSMIDKQDFERWFQQIWNIPGASCKEHPAPFPLELARRLVRMFSFAEDTVLDPFCGTGTSMVAALKCGRNSVGIEIDPDYCRMAARHLKAENHGFFNTAELKFEKIVQVQDGLRVKEELELYQIRPTRKRLGEIGGKGLDAQIGMLQVC
jgi:modification methylase